MFTIILIIVLGLCFGSFLNALVWRVGHSESIVRGRSKCPHCEKAIVWYDLVPMLSFIWLRGMCRNCRQVISWQYPLVELVTSVALVLLYAVFGLSNEFFVAALTTLFLIPIFLTDLRYKIIPDRIVVLGIIIILAVQIWAGAGVTNLLAAIAIGVGFFAWQYILSRGQWIGAGDIGLGALMGVTLGWPNILVALTTAYLGGAIVGIALMGLKKTVAATQLPFAPFLTTATFFTILYGKNIITFFQQFTR